MALPQGVNFRSTLAYVTDPANYHANIGTTLEYPVTTAQGNNVGWEADVASEIQFRDRNSGNDARLAGYNSAIFASGAATREYRIDLPSAGNYNIGFAAGDANYATNTAFDLYDDSSSLGSLTTGTTSAANNFKDATNTEYSAANWVTSQALRTEAFGSTILRVSAITGQALASLYVESAEPPPRRLILSSPLG